MLLTDHNNKGSHGPNPLWLLSLTPPHPSPISSAHIGSDLPAETFSCLSPLACLLPSLSLFLSDYLSPPTIILFGWRFFVVVLVSFLLLSL